MLFKNKMFVFFLLTVSSLASTAGIYFFRFPNDFTFGGVSGLAVVLRQWLPFSAASINLVISFALLAIGFLFLGKDFGIMTGYCTVLSSLALSAMEYLLPISAPLTNQPMLELCYAIAIPGFASAVLFRVGASSGGTDILAMLLRKYTSLTNLGAGLFCVDLLIVLLACFVFNVQTALYSFLGLMVKSLVIDNVIETINLCKYFNVICDNPEPICDFIINRLHHSATVCDARGAFTGGKKYIVFTVLKRPQAMALQRYVKSVEPTAFLLITNTSEIIGKGFQN